VAVLCAAGWLARPLSNEALFGVLIGAAVSYFVSWYFYQEAADELKDEAEELRRHTTLIMRGLEEFAKTGNLKWNLEEGKHRGIAFERDPIDAVNVSDTSLEKKVVRREDTTPEQE
jgi:hypothetical protein